MTNFASRLINISTTMKKVSKKMVGDFLADTKGETMWSVVSFDKKSGMRDLAHGGNDFFHAFAVITEQLHKGFDVILTDKAGWDAINVIETREHRRCTYNELKPYEIVVDSYSFRTYNPTI